MPIATALTGARSVPVRATIWALTLVLSAMGVLTMWAISSPPGSSPDDDYHMGSIWCPPPAQESGCQVRDVGTDHFAAQVPAPVALSAHCFAFQPANSGTCTTALSDDQLEWTARIDVGGYPGPYYRFAHVLVSSNVDSSVLRIRLFNSALAVALMSVVLFLAAPRLRRPILATMLLTSVPLGVFITASINPSSWGITGVFVTWSSFLVMFTSTAQWRRVAAAAVGVAGGVLAAVSRADAGLFAGFLSGLVALWCWRHLRQRPLTALPVVAVALIGLVSFFKAGQGGVLAGGFGGQRGPNSGWGAVFNNLINLPSLYAGALGTWNLGWLDTPMPSLTWLTMISVIGGLGLAAIGTMSRHRSLVLALMAFVMTALPLYLLFKSQNVVGENLQPRYLLPLLTFAVGLFLIPNGSAHGALGVRRRQAVVALMVAAAHAAAFNAQIRRYVTGTDVHGFNLDRVAEWWRAGWPSPMTSWAIGSSLFAVIALLVALPPRSVEGKRAVEVTAAADGEGLGHSGNPSTDAGLVP